MRYLLIVVALAALVGALFVFGPTEPVNVERVRRIQTDPDVAGWIAAREADVAKLRPAAAKRIVWAGAPGVRTPLAVVYLHGFLASPEELQPVPERVAAALGANLFFARLKGHGLTDNGATLGSATANDWLDDLAEALSVALAIGDRVVVIGTSTGGSLATLAAFRSDLSRDIAGVILVSPNFRQMRAGSSFLTLPFARSFVPWIMGQTREWRPQSVQHGAAWMTRYPSQAVVPMAALARAADSLPFEQAKTPALFIFADADKVVDETRTAEVAARWGGAGRVFKVMPRATDDADAHVIAGDILSPGLTEQVASEIVGWVRNLQH